MPWKNGLGKTFEIDRYPSDGDYLWRLSQAPILTDGPFSQFPGYDRWLCICEGDGIFLNDQKLERLTPFHFSGSDETNCRLISGKVLDLGLIYDPSRITTEMKIVRGSVALSLGTHYLFDLQSGDTQKFDYTSPSKPEVTEGILVSIYPL